MTKSLVAAGGHGVRSGFAALAGLVMVMVIAGCQSKTEIASSPTPSQTPTAASANKASATKAPESPSAIAPTPSENAEAPSDLNSPILKSPVASNRKDDRTDPGRFDSMRPDPDDPRIAGPEPSAMVAIHRPDGTTNDKPSDKPSEQPANDPEPTGALTVAELEEEYVPDPEIMAEIEAQRKAIREIADTYGPPPGVVQLGEQPDLWVDIKTKRVYIDGYVSMKRGPLEMLACPVGTKEHESVIALFAESSEVHAALLAVGAQSGTTARWDPEFSPPTGQTVGVWVIYREPNDAVNKAVIAAEGAAEGAAESAAESAAENETENLNDHSDDRYRPFVPSDRFQVVDARRWIRNVETQESLAEPWVFAGSEFWSDPEDQIEHYSANAGDMICVSNFSTAMMDVPFASSADAGNTLFEPFSERIPEPGTPVRVVLVPQPMATDAAKPKRDYDPTAKPDESALPMKQRRPVSLMPGAGSESNP